jgi:hypothetical protein
LRMNVRDLKFSAVLLEHHKFQAYSELILFGKAWFRVL